MIAAWMIFAIATAALFGAAAVAAARGASAVRLPTHTIWIAALAASSMWPIVALVLSRYHPMHGGAIALLEFTTIGGALGAPGATTWLATAMAGLDPLLASLWVVATLMLLARLAHASITLQRQRLSWQPSEIDGIAVRLSRDTGPAVVGFRTMDIVLPEWTLALEPPLLRMVLRHEEAHRQRHDPRILFIAALAVAIAPWNPVLWWCAHRLRLAMELDCDARVLAAHADPDRYSLLLMLLAQHASARITRFAPALTNPASNLERRIIAMRTTISRHALTRLLVFSSLAAMTIAIACSVDSPNAVQPSRAEAPAGPINDQDAYFEFQVEQPVALAAGNPAPLYPPALERAHVTGEVLAQFVVNPDGRADMATFKVLRSSNELFTQAVREVLPSTRFVAAEVGGHAVRQVVQIPYGFKTP